MRLKVSTRRTKEKALCESRGTQWAMRVLCARSRRKGRKIFAIKNGMNYAPHVVSRQSNLREKRQTKKTNFSTKR